MGINRSYSLSNVSLTIGTVNVNGFAPDDAFTWSWTADIWNRTTGADGDNLYSRNLERVVSAEISLLGTSRALATLFALLELQAGENTGITPPLLTPLPFMLIDAHTGDFLSAATTIFMSRPAPSRGATLGSAVFGIELPSPKYIPGTLNLLQQGV